jgi:hypothetical protein
MNKRNDLKLDGNKILWYNGEKWLIKETCVETGPTKNNIELAKKRIKELNNK